MVVQMGRTAPQAKTELLSPVDAQHFAAFPCRSRRHGREFDICQTPSANPANKRMKCQGYLCEAESYPPTRPPS